ncbi:3D domain-containing protein [Pilibacter termitis]|uniref:3D domain-containing protein n=1 Tax=Pilibacter termitis TaxID=263852 RepID=UPI00135635E8|nr:3D domain-containing protein [Pilibacter termitis]
MKRTTFLSLLLVVSFALPLVAVKATTLEEIKQNQANVSRETEELNENLNDALTKTNEKYRQITELQTELDKAKENLQKYNTDITKTEKSIAVRKEAVAEQMKQLQLNNQQNTFLEILLSSENLSDVINRSIAMNTIRNAQSEKITSLAEAKEKLVTLKEKVAKTAKELAENTEQMKKEASEMEQQVASLKAEVAKKQQVMQTLAQAQKTEETKIAEANARQERELAISQKQESIASDSGTESNAPATNQPSVSTGNGREMNVQATGYSCQEAGLSWHTATGIDLRQNPNVIAVDPSVIPLGTLVEVPGYGVAVAGDTGGAIVGNIIDLHFPTVQQALNWGRRNVTIKILS